MHPKQKYLTQICGLIIIQKKAVHQLTRAGDTCTTWTTLHDYHIINFH